MDHKKKVLDTLEVMIISMIKVHFNIIKKILIFLKDMNLLIFILSSIWYFFTLVFNKESLNETIFIKNVYIF